MSAKRPICPFCGETRELTPDGANFVCEVCGTTFPQYELTLAKARRIVRVGMGRARQLPAKGTAREEVSAAMILEEAEVEAIGDYIERVEPRSRRPR